MTREDIIRMAREICDLYRGDPYDKDCGTITMYPEELERIVNRAVEAEREACAKVCEERVGYWQRDDIRRDEDENCAAAIRARGSE
jgi:hypothetical protein